MSQLSLVLSIKSTNHNIGDITITIVIQETVKALLQMKLLLLWELVIVVMTN